MKTKLDIAALEHSIDFQAVTQTLNDLSSGETRKRQNSVIRLLDKVQPALLKARQSGVSLAVLTVTLKESGISVSEATLRRYFNAHAIRHKPRPRMAKTAPITEQPSVAPLTNSPSNVPPRLARRINQ